MSAISTILARLRSAIWAIDVRDDIADAIEQCYSDVSNPTLQTDALEAAIQEKIDEGEMAALTIGDGTITASKLAANAVTTPKIADGSITQAKLDPNIDFVQVDDTLSQTGEAADAAAVGAAIDELNGSLENQTAGTIVYDGIEGINVGLIGTYKGWFNQATNRIATVESDDCRILYYPAKSNCRYKIKKELSSTIYKIASCKAIPNINVALYNISVQDSSDTGEIEYTTEPETTYLAVYCVYNDANADAIVESVTVRETTTIKTKIDNLSSEVGSVSKSFDKLGIVYKSIGLGTQINAVISEGDGKWRINNSRGFATCAIIPIDDYVSIYLQTADNHACVYAFLKTARMSEAAVADFATNEFAKVIPNNGSVEAKIPVDANYLYVQCLTSSKVDITPTVQGGTYGFSNDSVNIAFEHICNLIGFVSDQNGRDVPQSLGVLNAYKKAHQLLDIEWNALATIPTNNSPTGVSSGHHTGMLYSEALEYEKYVMFGCSLKTFMTALHNPYSVMYTEDTKGTAARKKSAYGFNYNNTILNGAFYGTVCSSFVSYALGIDYNIQTYDFAWMAKKGLFGEVYDNSASGIRLMDVIWTNGHVQLVTDIIRDERGNPTTFYVTESWQDYVRNLTKNPAQMNDYIQTNNAKIYRYLGIYKNTEYEASEFVAVEDESAVSPYVYNDDICTYLGDCVSIADWESMFINYSKGNYTSMELYKDNALLQTISLPAEYNATHSIDVTSYLTGGGIYKARLTDGTNNSDYTYFEVVDTSVTTDYSDNELTVNFESDNAQPLYIKLKTISGGLKATYILSSVEKNKGVAKLNPLNLITEQGRTSPTSIIYARVFFKGTYNQVMGDYVDSGIYSA